MSCLSLTEFGDETKAKSASRGMTAEKPLKKGDRMITVAHKTALQVTSLDKKQSPFPSKIEQESWQRLPWFARLGLLIVDAKLDPKSNLQPWISRLPKSFDTPLHWSDEELNELQSPQMVEAVKQQRSLYKKLFDGINSNSNNMLARDMKYSDFVWAVECVRSRAFSGPLEVAPFKERIRLFLFIAANTLAWPALHVLPLENALNGSYNHMRNRRNVFGAGERVV